MPSVKTNNKKVVLKGVSPQIGDWNRNWGNQESRGTTSLSSAVTVGNPCLRKASLQKLEHLRTSCCASCSNVSNARAKDATELLKNRDLDLGYEMKI